MFDFEFLSLTQLGANFGVSSHKTGKWLVEIGLRARTPGGPLEPTDQAWKEGWCRMHVGDESSYPVWNRVEVTKLLIESGHRPAGAQAAPEPVKAKPPSGPFKLVEDENGGHRIVDGSGQSILTRNKKWLSRLANLVNHANQEGYL